MDYSLLLTIISPILLTAGGLITWFFKSKHEALIQIEEASKEKRMETYRFIIDPYIVIITGKASEKEQQKAISTMMSLEYKRHAHNLLFFGSDRTVRAYNRMMQNAFKTEQGDDPNFEKFHRSLKCYTEFLLSIRRDLYNKRTKLKRSEMIESWLTDIENHQDAVNKNE